MESINPPFSALAYEMRPPMHNELPNGDLACFSLCPLHDGVTFIGLVTIWNEVIRSPNNGLPYWRAGRLMDLPEGKCLLSGDRGNEPDRNGDEGEAKVA